jgi:hypothetical protein
MAQNGPSTKTPLLIEQHTRIYSVFLVTKQVADQHLSRKSETGLGRQSDCHYQA